MKKAIVLVITCFFLSIPSLAFCQTSSDPPGWSGNVNFFLGLKLLDEDDWKPVDEPLEGGILLDFKQNRWPVSIAVDILHADTDKNISVAVSDFGSFSLNMESKTTELNVGIRKIWDTLEYVRPFIGGGVAIIKAEVGGTALGVSVSENDTAVGGWIDAGIYLTLAEHFNIGLDARWSKAEVDLFGVTGEAGGWHIGGLVGFHW